MKDCSCEATTSTSSSNPGIGSPLWFTSCERKNKKKIVRQSRSD
jgi:hypothetical protein